MKETEETVDEKIESILSFKNVCKDKENFGK